MSSFNIETLEKDLLTFKESSLLTYELPTNLDSKTRREIYTICEKLGLCAEKVGSATMQKIVIMKEKKLEVTDSDRKQFIKDFSLPIPVYKEPYFSYFLELYDEIYNTKSKYQLLIDALNKVNNIKKCSYDLMEKITTEIKSRPEYAIFIKDQKYNEKELPNNVDIYVNNQKKWPKYYISLDLITANYNCVKFFDNNLVLNSNTWSELIGKFTEIEYFKESKHFRQIIFGNLHTKRIASIQKYILSFLYDKIKDKVKVLGKVSTDELIIDTCDKTIKDDYQKIVDIINDLPENMKKMWRIVILSIEPIGNSKAFVKKIYTSPELNSFKIEIKNIEKDFHAQAYKYYIGKDIEEYDRKGMKDDFLITYDDNYIF